MRCARLLATSTLQPVGPLSAIINAHRAAYLVRSRGQAGLPDGLDQPLGTETSSSSVITCVQKRRQTPSIANPDEMAVSTTRRTAATELRRSPNPAATSPKVVRRHLPSFICVAMPLIPSPPRAAS